MNKIRTHLEAHKELYLGLGLGLLLAGFTVLIVRDSRTKVLRAADSPAKESTESLIFAKSFFGNATNTVTTIHTGQRGPSGFVTKSLDTGELFSTQAAAAEAFGISKANLSSHLNGRYPDVSGYTFERVGVFEA